MQILLSLLVFIFGTIVGSFLNCVIYRLNVPGKSRRKAPGFLRGRSFCPHCKHKLGFFDLIPIVSFIILRGKCRYCKKRISWHYPAVEIATAGLFLLIFSSQAFSVFYIVYLLIISSLLIVIFVYDLKHYIIPDKIIYPAIAITLIFNFKFLISNEFLIFNFQKNPFFPSLLAGVGAGAFFFLIWFVSRGKWMGFGDVKLALFMGLFLGFPNILVALFSAFMIGAIIGLALIVLGRKKLKSQVPFGPFLIIGTFIALFCGQEIVKWYLSLI